MTQTSGYISETFRRLAAESEARGEARGEMRASRDALLRVLRAKGLTPSAKQKRRIEACDDPAELGTWLDRAAVAHRIADVFDPRG